MKNFRFILFLVVAGVTVLGCSTRGFRIDGEISNAEGAKVVLYGVGLTEQGALDSAIVSGGKFVVTGKVAEPCLCRLMLYPDAQGDIAAQGSASKALTADFYIENSEISFTADASTMAKYYWAPGRKVEKPVVKGSEQQEIKEVLDAFRQGVFDSLTVVGNRISEEYYGSETGNVELGAELALEEMRLMDRYYALTVDFVKQHPGAAVSFDEISYLFGEGGVCRFSAEQIEEFVSVLRTEWVGTEKFAALEEMAAAASRLSVGQKYIDAEFQTLDGEKVMLSSLIPQGKIVMLEFWASWCGPCRGEIPHLKRVRAEYPQFNIVSISVDDKEADWKKAVADEKMDWVQLKDTGFSGGRAMELYGVMGIPCCIILDEEGRFLRTNMRGPWLDAFLREYYSGK